MSHRAKIRLEKICRYANDGKESRNDDDDVENQQFSCLTEHTHSRKSGKERKRKRKSV